MIYFLIPLGYLNCKIYHVIYISLFMSLEKYIFLYYYFLDIKEMPLELEYWWSKETFRWCIVSGVTWVYCIFSLNLPMSISFTYFSWILSYPFTWILSSAFSLWYLTLCDCGFHSWGCLIIVLLCTSNCPLVEEDKRLAQASWWERLLLLKNLQQRHVLVVTHHRGRTPEAIVLGCFSLVWAPLIAI